MTGRRVAMLALGVIALVGSAFLVPRGAERSPTRSLDCTSNRWMSSTDDFGEGTPSPFHTEEAAMRAKWVPRGLPAALGIVDDPEIDGFLLVERTNAEATFDLMLDGRAKARVTVAKIDAGGYAVSGLTKCGD